jgi:hypothetical protein
MKKNNKIFKYPLNLHKFSAIFFISQSSTKLASTKKEIQFQFHIHHCRQLDKNPSTISTSLFVIRNNNDSQNQKNPHLKTLKKTQKEIESLFADCINGVRRFLSTTAQQRNETAPPMIALCRAITPRKP